MLIEAVQFPADVSTAFGQHRAQSDWLVGATGSSGSRTKLRGTKSGGWEMESGNFCVGSTVGPS